LNGNDLDGVIKDPVVGYRSAAPDWPGAAKPREQEDGL
jgi:hypothetical protein